MKKCYGPNRAQYINANVKRLYMTGGAYSHFLGRKKFTTEHRTG
jgi:hypothetical protein